MNWKLTAALVAIAVIIGAVVYFNPFTGEEDPRKKNPWFYQVSFDDIVKIEVTAGENKESFSKITESVWVIDRLGDIPPSHTRWGGIVLLLSGPQTKRDFSTIRPTIENPAEYGLDTPQLVVKIGLTGERELDFRLGDKTTDGNHHYGQVIGFPQLFLISDLWGEVLARLANEPPTPKWWQYRDPEILEEVNIYLGSSEGNEDGPYLRLQNNDGEWEARNFPEDEANRPLDPDKWAEYVNLVGGPVDIEIVEYGVRDRDYIDWGIDDKGKSVEIRFSGLTERGTKYVEGVLYLLGDKTEDGQRYYAVPPSDISLTPVITLSAEWVDAMFDLISNVPYAEETEG